MIPKKGIESVEVWMWLVAGLVIGGLIFGGSYALFSQWIKDNEIKLAKENFGLLKNAILNTCKLGTERAEEEKYIFPDIVNNITVMEKSTGDLMEGHLLCMDIEGEGRFCEEMDARPNDCKLPLVMESINFEKEKGLLLVIQKALGRKQPRNVEFLLNKRRSDHLCIYWDIKFEEAEMGIETSLDGEAGTCTITCDCEEQLYCDFTGHCCPKGEYFNGTACWSYAENGVCDPQVGENCVNNLDCMDECSSSGGVCCLGSTNPSLEESGCVMPPFTPLPDLSLCACNEECNSDHCTANEDDPEDKACCPERYWWDGADCVIPESDIMIFTTTRIYNELQTTLDNYLSILEADGYLAPIIIKADDDEDVKSCDPTLTAAAVPVSSNDAARIIGMCSVFYSAKNVLILGGHDDIRQLRLPDGACDDPTGEYFTDDLYVDLNNDGQSPDVPLGRIPTGLAGHTQIINNYIRNTAIPMHSGTKNDFSSRFGYLMAQGGAGAPWGGPDSFLGNNWGARCQSLPYCYVSPPSNDGGTAWTSQADFIFILQHGNEAGGQIFVDDTGRININPSSAYQRDWSTSVVMLEPCYGGRIHNIQGTGDSIILNMVAGGSSGASASVVLGGTATQLGTMSYGTNVCLNDPCTACLYDMFWDQSGTEQTYGQAFMNAKRSYINMNGCNPCNYRVGHQTQFYGDPTIKIR